MKTQSNLDPSKFVKPVDGKTTVLSILKNQNQCEVTLLNYGARIVSLLVPDSNGVLVDVVTGHNSIDEYLVSEEPYFGAICGRFGNRIEQGRFQLDGIVYDQLAINNGPNSLHGGIKGFNAQVWDTQQISATQVLFSYFSPDGEEGFPGNLQVEVLYTLTEQNALIIDYKAITNKPTILNLTNHSYFNLSGAGDPYVGDHLLKIRADKYLPTTVNAIPYGRAELVEGSVMDFRDFHTIGERIDKDDQQLEFGNGYDHTFLLNKPLGSFGPCAECISPKTGIKLTIETTEPGVQFYSANWMTGNFVGKNGVRYPKRAALCLETQHFPNSPNEPEYPSVVLRPGEVFKSKTVFGFTVTQK